MSFKTQSEYSYSQPVTIRAKMASGAVRTGQLIQVTNETTQARYQVILKTDRPSTCSCPHWVNRCKGSNRPCKHVLACQAQG